MKRLLVVVDYQKDFVDGALGFERAAALEQPIARKLLAARQSGWDVAFTLDTHGDDYLKTAEGRMLPVEHCLAGTPGHELYGTIADMVGPDDRVFTKNTFGCDALYEYCKSANYDEIELAGVVSHICVMTNAVLLKTALPEAKITVDAAAVASNDPDLEKAAFDVLRGLGITIV